MPISNAHDDGADLVAQVLRDNPPDIKGERPEWSERVGWHAKEDVHSGGSHRPSLESELKLVKSKIHSELLEEEIEKHAKLASNEKPEIEIDVRDFVARRRNDRPVLTNSTLKNERRLRPDDRPLMTNTTLKSERRLRPALRGSILLGNSLAYPEEIFETQNSWLSMWICCGLLTTVWVLWRYCAHYRHCDPSTIVRSTSHARSQSEIYKDV